MPSQSGGHTKSGLGLQGRETDKRTAMGAETTISAKGLRDVDWRFSDTPVDYPSAVAEMEERVAAIRAGTAPELVWLLEHPPLYSAGTSAKAGDLITPDRFPVYETGRGGQHT